MGNFLYNSLSKALKCDLWLRWAISFTIPHQINEICTETYQNTAQTKHCKTQPSQPIALIYIYICFQNVYAYIQTMCTIMHDYIQHIWCTIDYLLYTMCYVLCTIYYVYHIIYIICNILHTLFCVSSYQISTIV